MSVISVGGLPGKGKNVFTVHEARKHYKKTNSILRRLIRKIFKRETTVNNVYSNFPILLKNSRKEEKKIYSNKVMLNDLNLKNRFQKDSVIIIDEVQAIYDSDEFKDFPKEIAVFNQFHRHFDIKDIYYISQHPSRIVKKLRNIIPEFIKIRTFVIIPIIKLSFMYYSVYYEFDDYGKWHHPKKEAKTYDVKNKFKIFFARGVFTSYKSKYLNEIIKDKPLLTRGSYTSLDLDKKDILNMFGNIVNDNGETCLTIDKDDITFLKE